MCIKKLWAWPFGTTFGDVSFFGCLWIWIFPDDGGGRAGEKGKGKSGREGWLEHVKEKKRRRVKGRCSPGRGGTEATGVMH